MNRSIKERLSSEGSIRRLLIETSGSFSSAVFSMELTCFLRLLSQNFVPSVAATMITMNRTRKLMINGSTCCVPLYEISTTVWKIEAGNCMPDERRRS